MAANDPHGRPTAVRYGELVEGAVEAVFHWGVIVDLKMDHVGLIDALYIDDDDTYVVGEPVLAYLDLFDEMKQQYILRPPGQVRVSDRLGLADKGPAVDGVETDGG